MSDVEPQDSQSLPANTLAAKAESTKAPQCLEQIEQSLVNAKSQLAGIESVPLKLGIFPTDWREQLAKTEEMISQHLDELQSRLEGEEPTPQPEFNIVG